MITRIEIENFKGIRDRLSLDLKPITLLFGANSAGKSTIIHALHYALEVLRYNNLNAYRTTLGGDSVDLGGFRNLVHGHDDNRRIRMCFGFDVTGTLSDYMEGNVDERELSFADVDDLITTAWVRFDVGWSQTLNAPQVFSYEVGIDDQPDWPLVRIEAPVGKGQAAFLTVHAIHPIFGDGSVLHVDEDRVEGEGTTQLERLLSELDIATTAGLASLPLYRQQSAVPAPLVPLHLWLSGTPRTSSRIEIQSILSKLTVGIGEVLSAELERMLYIGPLRVIPPRDYTPKYTADLGRWADGLGAWDALGRPIPQFVDKVSEWMKRLGMGYRVELRRVREVPDASLRLLQSRLNQLVHGVVEEVVDELPKQLAASPTKKTKGSKAIKVRRKPRPLGTVVDAVWLRRVLEDVRAASDRNQLVLIDEKANIAVQPYDVGVGISQLLPVIVAALYRGERGAGSFVVIEQPELHIHPKLQVKLADLFIEQSVRGTVSDHQFLLETHSEHILLRLLRRIREASESPASTGAHKPKSRGGIKRVGGGGIHAPTGRGVSNATQEDVLEEGKPKLSAQMVNVIYAQRAKDGTTRFIPLRLDNAGEFLDVWPEGFFDERREELY